LGHTTQPNPELKILNYQLQRKAQLSGSAIIAAAVNHRCRHHMQPIWLLPVMCSAIGNEKISNFELKI